MVSRAELRDIFEGKLDRYIGTIDFHLRELNGYDNVLDSGAGTGNLTLELLKRGHVVTAVDLDDPSLNILRKKCFGYDGLDVRKMDVQSLDFGDNKFDAVSSMFVIPLVEDIRAYVSEVYDSLRKGGKFSISAWAPVENSWYEVVEHPREELMRKGVLPKYQEEFDALVESTKELVDVVLSGPDLCELKMILEDVGFRNIKNYDENPCKGYAYFLTCEK
jgi:ubiquinone/menaquinone biosynthesis C-methylase UbiE